ncbi:MAG: amidohydrolase family protein [Sphingomonas sp.]
MAAIAWAAGAGHALAGDKPKGDVVITNAVIMTVTHGTIEGGSVWIHGGKIAGVGKTVAAPAGARIIDARGRYLTPGIVEAHGHIGMGGLYDPQDTNEWLGKPWGRYAGPIQADLRIRDSIKTDDYGFYLMLSSGMTTALELPGSANIFGGQTVPIKMKVGRPREEMFIDDAPLSLKIACGGTPDRAWKGRGVGLEKPADVPAARAKADDAARAYLQKKEAYARALAAGDKTAVPPADDAKLDAIGEVLRGKGLIQMHCHYAGSITDELALAKANGFTLRTVHHGTESYKVAKTIAASGSAVLAISDLWGGSPQTQDGIPWNIVIDKRAGVRVALHGEAFSIARRLSQEAGKMLRYGKGSFDRNEALALVTLNAAWVFGLEDRIGSVDIGKDADLVVWDGDPLSTYGHAAQVFIDGELLFDAALPGLGLVNQPEENR